MFTKTFILKTGESETWINDQFDCISFGDVLRTTTILSSIQSEEIVWIGSPITFPLIPNLNNLIKIDVKNFNGNLLNELEDALVINLEKTNFTKKIKFNEFKNFCGFFWNENQWWLKSLDGLIFTLDSWNKNCSQLSINTWGAKLHHLIGKKSQHNLGHLPYELKDIQYDIGLNWQVGTKWPSKQIDKSKWQKIESLFAENYQVSWQIGHDSLSQYIEWILSCRLIITTDSLGMHLAMAYNKPVIALFGATAFTDVDKNDQSIFLNLTMPKEYNCLPCMKPHCSQNVHCSDFIDFDLIKENAIRLLNAK